MSGVLGETAQQEYVVSPAARGGGEPRSQMFVVQRRRMKVP